MTRTSAGEEQTVIELHVPFPHPAFFFLNPGLYSQSVSLEVAPVISECRLE